MQMEEFHGNEELFTPKKVDIVHHTPDLFNAEGGREGASLFLSFGPCFPPSSPSLPRSPSFSFAAPPPFSPKSIEIDSNSEKPPLSHALCGVGQGRDCGQAGGQAASVCCGSLKPEEGI